MARALSVSQMGALSGEFSLASYLNDIRHYPMLEAQEEYMLAKRWVQHEDSKAAHKLVTSHLRLVVKIAFGFKGYGLPMSEVVSEGNVGLMQAVKRFEPEKGFRLSTYAMWWIKASIQEYVLRSWSLVKMGTTANQKKLFFGLKRVKSKINAMSEGDLTPEQVAYIATDLGVERQEVIDMNRRLQGDSSLNAPMRDEGEGGEWQDLLADDRDSVENTMIADETASIRHKALQAAMSTLNPREVAIFTARRLLDAPKTLEELAALYAISRERVRQIEARAFEKVQAGVMLKLAA